MSVAPPRQPSFLRGRDMEFPLDPAPTDLASPRRVGGPGVLGRAAERDLLVPLDCRSGRGLLADDLVSGSAGCLVSGPRDLALGRAEGEGRRSFVSGMRPLDLGREGILLLPPSVSSGSAALTGMGGPLE